MLENWDLLQDHREFPRDIPASKKREFCYNHIIRNCLLLSQRFSPKSAFKAMAAPGKGNTDRRESHKPEEFIP